MNFEIFISFAVYYKTNTPMLTLNNVSFGYRNKSLFNDLSFSLPKGNVYGLLGLNGSGKTTLLYLMSGLLYANQGKVSFKDANVADRLPSILSDIFIVPEEYNLPRMSFDKYVRIHSRFYPRFSEQMLNASLEAFSMSRDIELSTLSMGQKKKAYMCFALATNVSLLLMDEPSNGLDIPSKSAFRKAVAQCMTDERSIVISTHQVRDVENLLDSVLILHNGQMLVNTSLSKVSEVLSFLELPTAADAHAAFYSQPSLNGVKAVVPNMSGMPETEVDLELLFNAAIANPNQNIIGAASNGINLEK